MLRRRLFICWCCTAFICVSLMLLLLSLDVQANSNPSSHATKQPFHADVISNFLNHRCGTFNDSGPFIWTYEGTLTDPLSGKVIAEVEGLELVKQLPMMTSRSSKSSDKALLNNLCTRNILFPKGKAQSSWDTATTVLSRKLFCYRRPSSMRYASGEVDSESNESPSKSLLRSLRLRPDGPLRHLSPLENMAVYDSAITYISRNHGREMVVFSELGGRPDINEVGNGNDINDGKRHYVMGSAQCGRDESSFSFSIYAFKGTLNTDIDHGPMLPPLKHPSRSDGSNEVVMSPPRSRLLQFGKGDGSSGSNGASARESYSYSMQESSNDASDIPMQKRNDNKSRFDLIGRLRKQERHPNPVVGRIQIPCTVKYTRYGEAPPWYAPGRMCTLELHGRRLADNVSTSQELTPLLSWAASNCKPSFWSGWPSISQTNTSPNKDIELAQEAVRLFSSESRRFILPKDLRDTERETWVSAAETILSRAQSRLKRLSKSFILSEIPRM
ncbi:hypothetical protein ACHAXM_005719 [Skeletonema potamos]